MRLRNIPRAESVLEACKEVVKDPESLRGNWNQTFKKEQPLHIEIGMGKGQFLLTLAAKTHKLTTSALSVIPAFCCVPLRNFRNWKQRGKLLPTSGSSVWMQMTCQPYSPRQKYHVST